MVLTMLATRPTFFPLPLIGWREDVHLPEFSSAALVAKIDTGARTAALHADAIEIMGKRVQFTLDVNGKTKRCSASLIGTRRIKSSNGMSELRPIISTLVELGLHQFETEITLTNRTDMGVPMLLGRNAMKGRFLVNPGRSFLGITTSILS